MFFPTPFPRAFCAFINLIIIFYMKSVFSSKAFCPQTGLTIIRIALAIVFLIAGIMKLSDMQMVIGFFGGVGLSPAIAWLVSVGEVVAGTALLLGVFTRIASLIVIIIMIGATIVTTKMTGLLSAEAVIFYGIAALALFVSGPGCWALAHKVSGCKCSCETCKDGSCCDGK